MKVRRLALAFVLLVSAAGAKAALADSIVYQQPITYGIVLPADQGLQLWDNFTLSSTATINGVTWIGNGIIPSSFTIGFYSDTSNMPGALLGSEVVSVNGTPDTNVNSYLDYVSTLTPITFTAGLQYWIEINSDSTTYQWGWVSGSGGDGFLVSSPDKGGTFSNLSLGDRAFTLTNSVATTPEPSSIALIGTGLLGIGGIVRRRYPRS